MKKSLIKQKNHDWFFNLTPHTLFFTQIFSFTSLFISFSLKVALFVLGLFKKYLIIGSLLVLSNSTMAYASNLLYDKDLDLSAEQKELEDSFPTLKKEIQEVFREQPIFTNINFRVTTKEAILQKMFTDISFSADRAYRYANMNYKVTNLGKGVYNVSDEPLLSGKLTTVSTDLNTNRYVYLVSGLYRGPLIIRGKMVVDIRFSTVGNTQYFRVKAYVTLLNDSVFTAVRKLSFFASFRTLLEDIIAKNVRNVIRIGTKTAKGIESEPEWRRTHAGKS